MSTQPIRLLFVCAGNSCRSQMAEAWTRKLHSGEIEVYSAGLEVHGLNRVAVRVMAEVGIDISHYRSKRIDSLRNVVFDYVVTVCGADAVCPLVPGAPRVIHMPFDDPPVLARHAASDEEAIQCYRVVRDQIRAFVLTLPGSLDRLHDVSHRES